MRAAVGTDYPLLMRVGGSEFIPGGCKRSDVQTFAVELEKAGVDLLNITGGPHETRVPQITMAVPRRAFAYPAQGIKSAVSIPVLASNRINDPADGEDIIRNGEADLVTMARALITDPDLPNKASEGKSRPDLSLYWLQPGLPGHAVSDSTGHLHAESQRRHGKRMSGLSYLETEKSPYHWWRPGRDESRLHGR